MKRPTKKTAKKPAEDEPKSAKFVMFMTPTQHEALRQAAFKSRISAAEIVRRGINLYLKGKPK